MEDEKKIREVDLNEVMSNIEKLRILDSNVTDLKKQLRVLKDAPPPKTALSGP
jgi:hypothetical protein